MSQFLCKIVLRLFYCGVLFSSACLCLAATPAIHPSVLFRHLNEQNGLADLTVSSIVQDRQGFLWFAGQSGLSRYDGYRFTIYRNDFGNPNSLSDIAVQTLHIDDQGRLWVGTRSGIQRYDPLTDNFVNYLTETRPAARADFLDVRTIAHDRQGNIWLGTRSGLRRLDPTTGRSVSMLHDANDPRSLSNDNVDALSFDDQGNPAATGFSSKNGFNGYTDCWRRA